jgi:uncharacterized protein (DUF58 family)
MPGDDLKYLDWKVLGRTDRYYIKQFEEETNLKSYLLVDSSCSMKFNSSDDSFRKASGIKKSFLKNQIESGTGSVSKIEYASYLAASLALLMHFQKDAAGLVTYDEKINSFISPRASSQNLKIILDRLNTLKAGGKTNTATSLNSVAEKIKKRGLVIILSDLLDEQSAVINALKHFRYRKNEVIVFHILDPIELGFAIDSPAIFKDMETEKEILSQPLSLLQAYKESVKEFIGIYRKECRRNKIDYVLCSTNTSFDKTLLEYLNKRKKLI